MKKTILCEVLMMMLIGISLFALAIPRVSALSDGTLYINPSFLAHQAAGTTLQYQVKVFNMPTFNTWDIQVAVDPTILNPTAIDTTVNTLTANFSVTVLPLTSCINGAGKACDPAAGDGPGVVHSAILPLGSPDPGSVITGVLFTITYSVVNPGGATGATTVHFGPTAPALANAGVPVAVSAINDGSYGALPQPTTTGVSCDSPIIVSQGSTCTVTVTDTSGTPTTPNGMVSFTGTGNITPLTASCTLSAGATAGTSTCTANFSGTATGTASVVGHYGGDFTHSSSTSTAATITVNPRPTTTTVSCSPGSIGTGQASTCTATVKDNPSNPGTATTPSGTVTFSNTGTAGGMFTGSPCTLQPGATGTATCTAGFTASSVGSANIIGTYTPSGTDTAHAGSASTGFTITVFAIEGTTTSLACDTPVVVTQASTCTATVTSTAPTNPTAPTGMVMFTATGSASGTFAGSPCTLTRIGTTASASCTSTFTGITSGSASVTGTYGGDSTHFTSDNSASPTVITVNARSTTTVVMCVSPEKVGQPSICTATVADSSTAGTASAPAGTVSFTQTGVTGYFTGFPCTLSQVGTTASASCTATFTASSSGTAAVGATYASTDSIHGASSTASAAGITVNPRSTSTTVTCTSPVSVNRASTCTVTVADTDTGSGTTPSGAVIFTSTGTGSLSGSSCNLSSGSCTVTFTGTAIGTATVTGTYGGDTAHSGSGPSTSNTITFQLAPNLRIDSVNVSSNQATVGQTVTVTVHVTNNGTVDEKFVINIKWADKTVASMNETLASGQSGTFMINWDTTRLNPATATLSVAIPPVSGETIASDNTATYGGFTLNAQQSPLLPATSLPFVVGGILAVIIILGVLVLAVRRRKTEAI